ncbi:MAG: hypothetical protein ACE14V_05905 [bacterium]
MINKPKTRAERHQWYIELYQDAFETPPEYPKIYDLEKNGSVLHLRNKIHNAGLDNHPKVVELDIKWLIHIYRQGYFELMWGHYRKYWKKHISLWWYHLQDIGKRAYPQYLLPEHLQEVNLKTAIERDKLLNFWYCSLFYPDGKHIPSTFMYYTSDVVMDTRDEIHQMGLDTDPKIIEIDKMVLNLALHKYRGDYKDEEQQDKPLESWWWHLDRIYDRTYPVELLPPHLRGIYLK